MNLENYFENVFFQFYNKVDEVGFYLEKSIENHKAYAATPIPRDIEQFNTAQFYFSAFINALISTWEISKLTIQIENALQNKEHRTGLASEIALAEDHSKFMGYFKSSKESDHELFKFLKSARNACAHDGTMSLNGGVGDKFNFLGSLQRYEYNSQKEKKCFEHVSLAPPQQDAISCMLLMAIRLIPLFEEKLKRPKLTGLTTLMPEKSTSAFISKFSNHLHV
ncbi:MAG: hypothetical protein ACRCTL_07575 [Pseudomonas sp.]